MVRLGGYVRGSKGGRKLGPCSVELRQALWGSAPAIGRFPTRRQLGRTWTKLEVESNTTLIKVGRFLAKFSQIGAMWGGQHPRRVSQPLSIRT